MPPAQVEPSKFAKPAQRGARIQLLAVLLGVFPLYGGLAFLQLRSDQPLSFRAFTLYLTVIAPLAIVIALLLLRFLCGESPGDLVLMPGKLSSDLLAALLLSFVVIAANVLAGHLLSEWFPDLPSNASITNLFLQLAGNPGLLIIFAGPLFFMGAASEEVIRVFLLSRLWKIWHSSAAKLLALVASACLFGLIHLYQGPVSAVWTAIFGSIMGFYYLPNAFQAVAFALLAR
jgi:hypothetical protein